MKDYFLSSKEHQKLVALVFNRNESLRLIKHIRVRNHLLECQHHIIEAEFGIWMFFRKHLCRVETLDDFMQLFEQFRHIFGDGYFVYEVRDALDLRLSKFSAFLAKQHAQAKAKRALVRQQS
jgi:hypothetical protein